MKEFKILIFLLIALPFTKAQDKCNFDVIVKSWCLCYKDNIDDGKMCNPGDICTSDYQICTKACVPDSKVDSQCFCKNSNTCFENQYCTKDGNCLDQCGIDVILLDGFCKCDNNICSKNQMCNGTVCRDVPNCTVNSPAPNPVCICQDDICEEGKICTSDGSCIEPPTNIPTTIPTTVNRNFK